MPNRPRRPLPARLDRQAASLAGVRNSCRRRSKPGRLTFCAENIDGYYLARVGVRDFAAGKQAQVALMAGWNLDEGSYRPFSPRATR